MKKHFTYLLILAFTFTYAGCTEKDNVKPDNKEEPKLDDKDKEEAPKKEEEPKKETPINTEEPKEDESIKPYKIELSVEGAISKTFSTIVANNIDEAIFKTKVTNKKGDVLDLPCKITLKGMEFEGTSFKTDSMGTYKFVASIDDIISNEHTIATKEDETKPYKIELTTDKSFSAHNTLIEAYNAQEVTFQVRVTDMKGDILNIPYTVTLDGSVFNGSIFKTDVAGDYVFEASIGELKSNKHTVSARYVADNYVSIESSRIIRINSVGLVTAGITFKNISNETLKYAAFHIGCYNKVNDLIKEEIKGTSSVSVQGTGFYTPGQISSPLWDIGYFSGVDHIKVKLYYVTLEDGKNIFAR